MRMNRFPRRFLTTIRYPGAESADYTSRLALSAPAAHPHPCFRLMNERGKLLPKADDPGETAGKQFSRRLLETMLRLHELDTTLLHAQRQGRIAFYMTTFGEEAAVIGAAAGLRPDDTVFAQYREQGVLLWRGADYASFCDQCTGNERGHGKGRQMPMHFGSRELNYHTISSPLATQIPHAVGAAYAKKMGGGGVVAVFFGEGAASEGDFAAAVNFAAVLDAPVVFICRNNGYAISTSTREQYAGDGVVARGTAAGIASVRVDGNDVWAVREAVVDAREYAERGRPVLLELMTYRASHHSTSDDSSRYRSKDEMASYAEHAGPIDRMRAYLVARGWWDLQEEKEFRERERSLVVEALGRAESVAKPGLETLFEDVYAEKIPSLRRQEELLHRGT